ncbi:MAG TPA: hypothetical protein VFQ38_23840 [Longimicrobiales bacterium]|nr:hypothetical protein [Longimicrobiales bacterium]
MLPVETILRELKDFDPGGSPTLTVYLATDPSRGAGANLDAQLTDLLRPLEEQLAGAPAQHEELLADAALLKDELAELAPLPRGLAFFSCAALGFLRVLPLRVRLRPSIHWGARFDLRPLLAALDEHEHVLVLLLDKEKARLFRVFLDEIEELEDLWDYVPNKQRQGGYAQANIQRDHEGHVLAHVRHAVEALQLLDAREKVDRILVGGPQEVIAHFEALLPKHLRTRVFTSVHVPLFSSAAEVLEAVQTANRTLERDAERRLVAELIESRGRGMAAFGAEAVLDAVNDERVQLLVIGEGLRLSGAECTRCARLVADPGPATCPACGGLLHRLPDLVQRVEAEVLRHGGQVEEVREAAAAALAAQGSVAVRVRYPQPAEVAGGGQP